jgi:hypothetical protein
LRECNGSLKINVWELYIKLSPVNLNVKKGCRAKPKGLNGNCKVDKNNIRYRLCLNFPNNSKKIPMY